MKKMPGSKSKIQISGKNKRVYTKIQVILNMEYSRIF